MAQKRKLSAEFLEMPELFFEEETSYTSFESLVVNVMQWY